MVGSGKWVEDELGAKMGAGSVLIGVAIALVVGAYLARPFRKVAMDQDRVIEGWIAQVRAEGTDVRRTEQSSEQVNFCHQCGRRAGPDDRFCAGCGIPLRELQG